MRRSPCAAGRTSRLHRPQFAAGLLAKPVHANVQFSACFSITLRKAFLSSTGMALRRAAAAAAGTAGAAAQPGRASILGTFITNSADFTGDAKRALDVVAGAMKSEKLAALRFTDRGAAESITSLPGRDWRRRVTTVARPLRH